MMPAYILAHIDVKDPIRYEDYRALVLETMTPHGGRFLVRGARPRSSRARGTPSGW